MLYTEIDKLFSHFSRLNEMVKTDKKCQQRYVINRERRLTKRWVKTSRLSDGKVKAVAHAQET